MDRAHARWRVAVERYREPEARLQQALDAARARGGPTPGQLEAAWNLPGVEEAHTNEERAFGELDPICAAIWRLPAATPAGLAVKARAALVHIWPRGDFEADAAAGDEEDLTEQSARRLIEACCTLAGVDWRGDPIAPPLPDPIFSAIKRHLSARTACVGLDDGVDEDRYEAAHQRRIKALNTVESTKPTTLAGLLALARHMDEYLNEDAGGQNTVEPTASGHAFVALINACLGLNEMRYPRDQDRAAAAAMSEASSAGGDQSRAPTLVGMLDLASASMDDLQSLHDVADLVGGVAYATVWTARCKARGQEDEPNIAGKLMQWLGEALTDVETAAEKEAARRVPNNRNDRETRLSMLAAGIIENGDPEGIEELACELLAHAKVERGEG